MGICSSCEATAVVKSGSSHTSHKVTSKIVLPNGKLQELERPLKVSDALNEILYNGKLDESHEEEEEEEQKSSCSYFLCNPDEMELDGLVKGMEEDEEVQPGQLYFLLPTSMLSKPLRAKEMATLAVRATNALSTLVINLQYSSAAAAAAAAGQYYYDLCNTHSHSSSRGSNYDYDASTAAVTASVSTLDLAQQQQQQGRGAGRSDHSRRRRVGSRGKSGSFSSDLGSIPEE